MLSFSGTRTLARLPQWHVLLPTANPFHEASKYPMKYIAIYNALNAIERRFQPHTYYKKAEPGTSPDTAAAAAANYVSSKTRYRGGQTGGLGPSNGPSANDQSPIFHARLPPFANI